MKSRQLGNNGPFVSALGLGCMGMSEGYGRPNEVDGLATIHRALDHGMNFIDTADIYGPHTNELLVGRAIRDRRSQVVLATKFGFVSGANTPADFGKDDIRRAQPRFQGENFSRNLQLVSELKRLAETRGCTPAQLALAWVLSRGDQVIPIPGTRRIRNLEDNLGALSVTLSPAELSSLEVIFPLAAISGARYDEAMLGLIAP